MSAISPLIPSVMNRPTSAQIPNQEENRGKNPQLIHLATDMSKASAADRLNSAFFFEANHPDMPSLDPRHILRFINKHQPKLKAQEKSELFKKLCAAIAQSRKDNPEKINTPLFLQEIEEAFEQHIQQETVNTFYTEFPWLESNQAFSKDLHAYFSVLDQEIINNPLGRNGTAELKRHIKGTHRDTKTPPPVGQSMETNLFIRLRKETLRLILAIGQGELSKDTALEILIILLIFHLVPGLDIIVVVYYLQKYGLYNNSISLVDNIIINSHQLAKMTLLNEYISTMINNHDKLMGIKAKLGETLKTKYSALRNDETPTVIALNNLLSPEVKDDNKENIKKSEQFYDLLQDRLATIEGPLTADNIKSTLQAHADQLFTKAFFPAPEIASNQDGTLVSNDGHHGNSDVDKIINCLVPVILATRECIHYEEAIPDQNTTQPVRNIPTNAFRVLNNQIKNAEMNMHDLIHDVPFRDYGKVQTFADYLDEVQVDPITAKLFGVNAQSDVFRFSVTINGKDYDLKGLLKELAVLKNLEQPFIDRFGDPRGIKTHAFMDNANQTTTSGRNSNSGNEAEINVEIQED